MTWLKLDDTLPENPKILEAGPLAAWLYVSGLAYCARNLTDGFIPQGAVRALTDDTSQATTLVEVGLWTTAERGYQVHDYLEHQRSREQIDNDRTAARERQAARRTRKAVEAPPAEGQEIDAAEIRRRLLAACEKVGGETDEAIGIYRSISTKIIPEALKKYEGVKGIGDASLQNIITTHAAGFFLGTDLDTSTLRRLSGLRRDYGFRVIEELPKAALGAKGDPINYLAAILRKGVQ